MGGDGALAGVEGFLDDPVDGVVVVGDPVAGVVLEVRQRGSCLAALGVVLGVLVDGPAVEAGAALANGPPKLIVVDGTGGAAAGVGGDFVISGAGGILIGVVDPGTVGGGLGAVGPQLAGDPAPAVVVPLGGESVGAGEAQGLAGGRIEGAAFAVA